VTRLALLVPLIVAAFLRFHRIGLPVLTSDEAFSWRLIRYPVPGMLRRLVLDVHPPLYYFALDAWASVCGDSPAAIRSLSAVLGVAAVAMGYAVCGEALRFGGDGASSRARMGALLVAVVMALQTAAVAHGRNARMYALAILLGAVTCWSLLRALRAGESKRRWWVLYALSVAAFCATHYYALFIVAAQAIFVLVASRSPAAPLPSGARRRMMVALGFAAVLYAPWLPVMLRQVEQVRQDYWIPAPSFSTLAVSIVNWAAGTEVRFGPPLPWLLLLGALIAWAWLRGGVGARLLLLQALLPWVLGLGLSLLAGRPIVLDRYMAFGQFFLVCAWGVAWARVPFAFARTVAAVVLVGLSAAGLADTWNSRYPERPPAFWYAARYLKRQTAPGDLVLVRSPRPLNKLRVYGQIHDASRLDVRYYAASAERHDHFSHWPSLDEGDILTSDPFLDLTPRTIWRVEDYRTAPEAPPPGWTMTHARMLEGGDAPKVLIAGYAPTGSAPR
jgi:hypothetical protein